MHFAGFITSRTGRVPALILRAEPVSLPPQLRPAGSCVSPTAGRSLSRASANSYTP